MTVEFRSSASPVFCLLQKAGEQEGRKGRKGREEKEGQGETMEERDRKEEAESEESRLVEFKASFLSRAHILGSCESRNPIVAVSPGCSCLSLGRREGGQTFTGEDPL